VKPGSVLLFGATGGIGRILVRHFADRERVVTAVSRSVAGEPSGGQTGAARLFCLQADIGSADQVVAAFAAHERQWGEAPDVVVNAAALQAPIGNFWQVDPAEWENTVAVNLSGSFLVLAEAVRRMRTRAAGSILLLSGGGAVYSRPGFSAYAASKAGLLRLVENAADELAAAGLAGIRVFAVAPGAVRSRMTEEVLAVGDRVGEKAMQEAVTTMESGGTDPAEITRLVDFLTGPGSTGLSGRLIHVREDYLQYADRSGQAIRSETGKLRRIPL
jgi:NAD(P)-dependent dehydrogenase (short-subunit alcohol dehydrogenase family)